MSGGEWEPEAENWVRWARTPRHDAYWFYRDVFFDQLLPPPGQGTIEIGCGEGRVASELTARGHRVVGIDSSLTLLHHARTGSADTFYALGDGAALPFLGLSVFLCERTSAGSPSGQSSRADTDVCGYAA